MTSNKRPRGRPKKTTTYDWLDNQPEHIKNWAFGENINEETRSYYREIAEEFRRDSVSDSVRVAYEQGRNTANKNRERGKNALLNSIYTSYKILIDNQKIKHTDVARKILNKPTKFSYIPLGTLRKYIAAIRHNIFGKAK